MTNLLAVAAFSALAYDARLRAVQILISAGDQGLPAGDIARALVMPQNTLSSHLAELARANLIVAERKGRSIIYRANAPEIEQLATFLMSMVTK